MNGVVCADASTANIGEIAHRERASLHPRAAALLRAALAIVIGLNAAKLAMATTQSPSHSTYTDFEFYWRAVRLWSLGIDPYAMRPGTWPVTWPLRDRLFYPLPALLLVWPLHWLALQAAAGIFAATSAAWLAWACTETNQWRRLLGFCTPMFLAAVIYGQWSPLLTVGALLPAAGFLLASKPTLGLACFAYRPTRRGAVSVALIGFISILLWPTWPLEWIDNLGSVRHHPPPIATPLGWLLLLTIARWRQPEARLLLLMAIVPQYLAFADQLPLVLVARTALEGLCLSIGGFVALTFALLSFGLASHVSQRGDEYVMIGCYLPALWIVLRRPNSGPAPVWLEEWVRYWPKWLRGYPCIDTIA